MYYLSTFFAINDKIILEACKLEAASIFKNDFAREPVPLVQARSRLSLTMIWLGVEMTFPPSI